MKAVHTLLYLRGERTLEDLRRGRKEFSQARQEENRYLLDGRDLDLLEMVHENPDLLKPNFTGLSRRTGVPVATLFDRWRRLKEKKERLVIRVQPLKNGEGLKGLSSPSERGFRRAYRKPFPSVSEGRPFGLFQVFLSFLVMPQRRGKWHDPIRGQASR